MFEHRTPDGDRLPFEISIVEGGAGAASHPLLASQPVMDRRTPTARACHLARPVAEVVWRGTAGESRTSLALDSWTLDPDLAGALPGAAQLAELATFADRVRTRATHDLSDDREQSSTADRLNLLVVASLRRKRAVRVHPETGALLEQQS